MKIWIFSLCRNEKDMVPFYLRHYETFADRILVWDDWSNDGTRDLLGKHPKVDLMNWPYDNGIDEDQFLQFAINTYKMARGKADWVMWVDMDEFVWGKDVPDILDEAGRQGYQVARTEGWNVVGEGLPADDGRQLWEQLPLGVPAPVYSKPVVFQPSADVRWNRGKHALENCHPRVSPYAILKLLHFRYLGRTYTATKNARNYARCGLKSGDKGAAWSCAPDYHGEHSADWAEQVKPKAVNILKS